MESEIFSIGLYSATFIALSIILIPVVALTIWVRKAKGGTLKKYKVSFIVGWLAVFTFFYFLGAHSFDALGYAGALFIIAIFIDWIIRQMIRK